MLPGAQLGDGAPALQRLAQALVQRELDGDVRDVPQQRRQQPVVQPRDALLPHNAPRALQRSVPIGTLQVAMRLQSRTMLAAALQAAHGTALRCPPSPLCSAHPAMQCVVSRAFKLQEAAPGPCLLPGLLEHCKQPMAEPLVPHGAADKCMLSQKSGTDRQIAA